jgi:uncharacterized delta-60 repeat protein
MVVWRRCAFVCILTSVLAAASVATALATPGSLDSAFGGDGKVTTDFTAKNDFANGVAIQTDGKIVLVGRAAGRGGQFALARYMAGGSLDTTFSGDGKVVTNFTAKNDVANAVAIQANGKIVVVGRAGKKGGRFALARYRANGHLDHTFGGDGKVVTNFTPKNDVAFAVAIQSNGKIVVAGRAGSPAKFALARYNRNGTLDKTFSGDGKVTTNFSASPDIVRGVAIQTDGKIVVAGRGGSPANFALARYNSNGTLDGTFGSGGKVTTNVNHTDANQANAVALQIDGKIVAAGFDVTNGPPKVTKFAVARYNTDGTLDATFESGDGMMDARLTGDDIGYGVALQADGKIVVGGRAGTRFGVLRLTTSGFRDTSFGGNGDATTDFSPDRDAAHGVAIQSNGKIVLAGSAGNGAMFALARFLGG